jgi:hypothetical protein
LILFCPIGGGLLCRTEEVRQAACRMQLDRKKGWRF